MLFDIFVDDRDDTDYHRWHVCMLVSFCIDVKNGNYVVLVMLALADSVVLMW